MKLNKNKMRVIAIIKICENILSKALLTYLPYNRILIKGYTLMTKLFLCT